MSDGREESVDKRTLRVTLITGTSALAAISLTERACSFAANLLAARLAGASVFGAYALALTTANNVATYAGAGIGTTANRFAGRYRRGTPGYAALVRALTLVSVTSAVVAVALLLAGAPVLARLLLRNPSLTFLLQAAAVSAGVLVLVECLRGFLIGERLYSRLAVLAVSIGAGMLIVLPAVAHLGPIAMIASQSVISILAVAACLIWRQRRETPASIDVHDTTPLPSAAAIWRFGLVQFTGVVGLNAAGWWVAALVGRADTTLAAAGLFAIASQLRNIVSLAPNLLVQSGYALLADETGAARSREVLVQCTFFAALASVPLAGGVAAVAEWAVPFVFGPSFGGAGLVVALAMSTAIVHMTGAAAAARLTVVSLPATARINMIWTLVTIAAATSLVPRWGAPAAMGVYLCAHLISVGAVLLALRRVEAVPASLGGMFAVTVIAALALAALAIGRVGVPSIAGVMSAMMAIVTVATTVGLAGYGVARGLLPQRLHASAFRRLLGRAPARRVT